MKRREERYMKFVVIREPKSLKDNNGLINQECAQNGGNCCAAGYCCQRGNGPTKI